MAAGCSNSAADSMARARNEGSVSCAATGAASNRSAHARAAQRGLGRRSFPIGGANVHTAGHTATCAPLNRLTNCKANELETELPPGNIADLRPGLTAGRSSSNLEGAATRSPGDRAAASIRPRCGRSPRCRGRRNRSPRSRNRPGRSEQRAGKPIRKTIAAQAAAYQNVRICQSKCDSSQVPLASPRFT